MTENEIIEMAIEAEFVSHGKPSDEESELFVCVDKDIIAFAKLVAEKERKWVGLTDDEQQQAYEQWQNDGWGVFYNAIEAKLKEKNT